MKEAFEKIREKIREIGNIQFQSYSKPLIAVEDVIPIVDAVEAEWKNDGWIPCSERMPTEEECGAFGGVWFQTTVVANGKRTLPMQCEHTTIRGKEMTRWLYCGRVAPWEVLAWKPLDEPHNPEKGEQDGR